MYHGHQASADLAKAVAAQQVQSQGAQQGQHLDAITLGVERDAAGVGLHQHAIEGLNNAAAGPEDRG